MAIVVGLDLSYSATGVARVSSRTGTKPKTALVRAPAADKAPWGERAQVILQGIYPWAKQADLVIIEGPAWARIEAAFRLGKLTGVVEHRLYRLGINYEFAAPSSVKKFATGSGRATKEDMVAAAQLYLPDLTNDNEADALFLALWGLHHIR